MSANRPISRAGFLEQHKAYHWIMDETYLACSGSGPDLSIAADLLVREEPDEEEEDGEEHDPDEEDDDEDEGYSE